MQDDDRRRIKRRHIMCYSRIFDRRSGELVGFLNDIHPSGMNILSDLPLQPNSIYRFRLDLPEYVFGKSYMELTATCRWSRLDIDPHFYIAGFLLEGVSEEDSEIIEQLNREFELER
jgi:hypothetical protein